MRSVTQKAKQRHNNMLTPEWLTIKQAADYAGVTKPTIRQWMKMGCRFIKRNVNFVRIKKDWIDDYLISFEGTSQVTGNKIAKTIAGMR